METVAAVTTVLLLFALTIIIVVVFRKRFVHIDLTCTAHRARKNPFSLPVCLGALRMRLYATPQPHNPTTPQPHTWGCGSWVVGLLGCGVVGLLGCGVA